MARTIKLNKSGKPRKKYTYKSEATRQALAEKARARLAKTRQALEISKKQNKTAYEEYVSEYYKISKKLRKGKVKVTETGRADLLTKEQFEDYQNKSKLSAADIAVKSYPLLEESNAYVLQQALKEKGFNITLEQAQAKQLTPAMWNCIDEEYQSLSMDGTNWETASDSIATWFFGS